MVPRRFAWFEWVLRGKTREQSFGRSPQPTVYIKIFSRLFRTIMWQSIPYHGTFGKVNPLRSGHLSKFQRTARCSLADAGHLRFPVPEFREPIRSQKLCANLRLIFSYTMAVWNLPQTRLCDFAFHCKGYGGTIPAPIGTMPDTPLFQGLKTQSRLMTFGDRLRWLATNCLTGWSGTVPARGLPTRHHFQKPESYSFAADGTQRRPSDTQSRSILYALPKRRGSSISTAQVAFRLMLRLGRRPVVAGTRICSRHLGWHYSSPIRIGVFLGVHRKAVSL